MSYTKKPIPYSGFSISFILAGVFVICALVVLGIFAYSMFNSGINNFSGGEATLFLAFENDGRGRMFQGEVVTGMTVLDALIASSEAGQIRLKYSFTKDGKVAIEQLDGLGDEELFKKPFFYLNDQIIDTEIIDKIVIKSGDKVEIRLE